MKNHPSAEITAESVLKWCLLLKTSKKFKRKIPGHNFNSSIRNLTTCVEFLTQQNQAHNVFITRAQPIRTTGPEREEDRAGRRPQYVTAYVFPRVNAAGAKPPTSFNPAACELAGCLTSYISARLLRYPEQSTTGHITLFT
ncbi:hypothetical protein ANCCAN_14636 [Ancylostoma caninum]|uniref:Uncharacterized protein n=1 Tax=Ancylostoma caninum TaxID=29170 RepID=A0A368G8V0_ANCCA|nr:hypothetical protein ANCCAN_14636 [Ancylostoma caninum]